MRLYPMRFLLNEFPSQYRHKLDQPRIVVLMTSPTSRQPSQASVYIDRQPAQRGLVVFLTSSVLGVTWKVRQARTDAASLPTIWKLSNH